jgi:hypothetical protein
MSDDNEEYKDYISERELLYGVEQQNYQSFEKIIITLSSAFLAFSLSFLALFSSKGTAEASTFHFAYISTLVASWILFAVSVVAILVSILLGAIASRYQLFEYEQEMEGIRPSVKSGVLTKVIFVLYAVSAIGFVAGLITLMIFCARNVIHF